MAYHDDVVATTGIARFYRQTETSGTTAVDEMGAQNGTYGGTPALNQATLLAGDTDPSVLYDGVNDQISVAHAGAMPLTGNVSLECWVKPAALPTSGNQLHGLVCKAAQITLRMWWNGGSIRFSGECRTATSTYVQAPGTTLPVVGTTYHVVVVKDATNGRLKLYVNGSLEADVACAATFATTNGLGVGSEVGTRWSNAYIQAPAIYTVALDATTIGDHYTSGITAPTLFRTASDSFSISDAVTRTSGRPRTTADSFAVSDAATRISSRSRSTADLFAVSDSPARVVAIARVATDSFAVSDSNAVSAGKTRATTDTFTISDAAARGNLGTVRTTADQITVSDQPARLVSLTRAAGDTVFVSDSTTRATGTARTATDTFSIADAATGSAGKTRTATDTFSISDAATRGIQAFTRTAGDTITVSDVVFRVVSGARTAADAFTFVDGTSISEGKTRSAADAFSVSDAASRVVALARAAVDTFVFSDSVTFTTDLAPLPAVGVVEPGSTATRVTEGRHAPMQLVGG